MNQPLARNLLTILQDNGLYFSILALSNQEIAELSQALQSAMNVARNCVYLRTHEEAKS